MLETLNGQNGGSSEVIIRSRCIAQQDLRRLSAAVL